MVRPARSSHRFVSFGLSRAETKTEESQAAILLARLPHWIPCAVRSFQQLFRKRFTDEGTSTTAFFLNETFVCCLKYSILNISLFFCELFLLENEMWGFLLFQQSRQILQWTHFSEELIFTNLTISKYLK